MFKLTEHDIEATNFPPGSDCIQRNDQKNQIRPNLKHPIIKEYKIAFHFLKQLS